VNEKLLAERFRIDRWTCSPAQLLPLESRGLHREMLSQAWRHGGTLPGASLAIRDLVNATSDEWGRAWPAVAPYWRADGDGNILTVDADLGWSIPEPGQRAQGRPWISLNLRRAVFIRDGCACVQCGALDLLELDHVIPFSLGGPDTVANLRVLCRRCNRKRGAQCG
jgi:HNH endonuclease